MFVPSFNELKLLSVSVLALTTLLADTLTEVKGWEDLGLKALLLVFVVFLIKQLMKEREEAKHEHTDLHAGYQAKIESIREKAELEIKAIRNEHKNDFSEINEKFTKALGDITGVLASVRDETSQQTNYFKTVTRNIVDERLSRKEKQKQAEQEQQTTPT